MAIAFGKMEDMVLLTEIHDLLKAQNCTEDIRKLNDLLFYHKLFEIHGCIEGPIELSEFTKNCSAFLKNRTGLSEGRQLIL